VRLVASSAHQLDPHRIGDIGRGLATCMWRLPHRGEWAGNTTLGQLRPATRELRLAARGDRDHIDGELDTHRDRVAGCGVTGVQGDERVDVTVVRACSFGHLEAHGVGELSELGSAAGFRDHFGVAIDPDDLDRMDPYVSRAPREQQGQIRAAAAHVENPDHRMARPQLAQRRPE
jgi:hypothetical protein